MLYGSNIHHVRLKPGNSTYRRSPVIIKSPNQTKQIFETLDTHNDRHLLHFTEAMVITVQVQAICIPKAPEGSRNFNSSIPKAIDLCSDCWICVFDCCGAEMIPDILEFLWLRRFDMVTSTSSHLLNATIEVLKTTKWFKSTDFVIWSLFVDNNDHCLLLMLANILRFTLSFYHNFRRRFQILFW